jgi:hypothetical protein
VDNRQEQLRARAYGIWQAEGEPHGRDREHWEKAERELALSESEDPVGGETEASGVVTPEAAKPTPAPRAPAAGAGAAKPKSRKPRAAKPA